VMFYAPLPLGAFIVVAAITSFACGAVVVAFAFAKESVPVRFLGTISGAVNVGNMLGPTLLQPAIGWMLDRRWSGAFAAGARVYPVDAFNNAFTLIVAWAVLTCLLVAFSKDTLCRQTA
jgi:MFS family permease